MSEVSDDSIMLESSIDQTNGYNESFLSWGGDVDPSMLEIFTARPIGWPNQDVLNGNDGLDLNHGDSSNGENMDEFVNFDNDKPTFEN